MTYVGLARAQTRYMDLKITQQQSQPTTIRKLCKIESSNTNIYIVNYKRNKLDSECQLEWKKRQIFFLSNAVTWIISL